MRWASALSIWLPGTGGLRGERLARVADGRMFSADAALAAGLVDKIGYLSDAIMESKRLAGLDPNARVVTYRRSEYANDNLYNTVTRPQPADGVGRHGAHCRPVRPGRRGFIICGLRPWEPPS